MKIRIKTEVLFTDDYEEIEKHVVITENENMNIKSILDVHNEKVGALERKLTK